MQRMKEISHVSPKGPPPRFPERPPPRFSEGPPPRILGRLRAND
jgi:hypothetical protein